jgi:hypothetical protein
VGHPVTAGHKYRDLVLQVGELAGRLRNLPSYKEILLRNPKKRKPDGTNLAESSKKGYGSKGAVS